MSTESSTEAEVTKAPSIYELVLPRRQRNGQLSLVIKDPFDRCYVPVMSSWFGPEDWAQPWKDTLLSVGAASLPGGTR